MHLTKALGPDGMSAIFFQKYWDVIGNDITCTVLNVLNSNMPIVDITCTVLNAALGASNAYALHDKITETLRDNGG